MEEEPLQLQEKTEEVEQQEHQDVNDNEEVNQEEGSQEELEDNEALEEDDDEEEFDEEEDDEEPVDQEEGQEGEEVVEKPKKTRAKKKKPSQAESNKEEEFDDDFPFIKQIRKMILDNLNRERVQKDLSPFYIHAMTNDIAQEYSLFLKGNAHNQEQIASLVDEYKCVTEFQTIYGSVRFESSNVSRQKIMDSFQELGYVLMECQEDSKYLFDPQYNHMGLGITCTETQVIVVMMLSYSKLVISQVLADENNKLEIHGKMLDQRYGLYAVSIQNTIGKDLIPYVSPEHIEFDRESKKFIIHADIENPFNPQLRKFIGLYTRANPDSIPYKKFFREKINLKHLEMVSKIPCQQFPNLKIMDINEEELFLKRFQEEENAKKIQELEKLRQMEDEEKKQQEEEEDQIDEEDLQEKMLKEEISFQRKKLQMEQQKDQISNKEIREELEIAISEASKQYEELQQLNFGLQEKIKQMKNKNDSFLENQTDMAMNQHKYLNTLAHVHQIRLDLKQAQDKYNQMAWELQQKLEEKEKKCNEIKQAFVELKREVAKKAVFSRTEKPIPERVVQDWEDRESFKNKNLQELRLEILRLRNQLVKNQKTLKKKDELAEGLHLIDFEQLKIENQTYNEKIEERNEDLHKLKKKNTNTVQILTHTREKLGYLTKLDEELANQGKEKETELMKLRETLAELKKDREDLIKSNIKLKQQTGIVNSIQLTVDFNNRKKRIEDLKKVKEDLGGKLKQMYDVIQKFEMHASSQTK